MLTYTAAIPHGDRSAVPPPTHQSIISHCVRFMATLSSKQESALTTCTVPTVAPVVGRASVGVVHSSMVLSSSTQTAAFSCRGRCAARCGTLARRARSPRLHAPRTGERSPCATGHRRSTQCCRSHWPCRWHVPSRISLRNASAATARFVTQEHVQASGRVSHSCGSW
jgi:hypothetical protein